MRIALLLALVLAIEEAVTVMKQRPSLRAAGGDAAVRSALRDWSTRGYPADAHAVLDSIPTAATRDWLAALRGTGTRISWESSLPAIAVVVEPLADPKRASRVFIAAPSASKVALGDSLGAMDSVVVRRFGATAGPAMIHGSLRAAAGGAVAVANVPDSLAIRPLLVIGRAGWEGKFLVSSLEEYGWKVDARLAVSPGNDVLLGPASPAIDTSRYAAVIVLDASAARYAAAIQQYVRRGGGLVAIGEGGTLSALSAILPATAGDEIPAGDVTGAQPTSGLALRPLALKAGAVPLQRRGNGVAVAAMRIGSGRVVQVGYVDSWRWRMGGRGDAPDDYRSWLSSVIGSAAYAPRAERATSASSDAAPIATLHSSLGPPSASPRGLGGGDGSRWMAFLFFAAISALVLETASRRIDGKP
jgi:hypothetical protein